MKKQDQELVERFLEDFKKELTAKYKNEIDFILLFGSAARGEWKRGVSDIDLIIQVKNSGVKKEIFKYTEEIFWKLDEKYDTKFKDVCSIQKTEKISFVNAIKFAERQARLYVPFEVIGPNEIDWKKCDFNDPFYKIGAFLVFPKSMFFIKVKTEGKILYGKNILKEIKPGLSFWDVFKILLNPYHLSMLSFATVLFAPDFAIKHAIKAILYEIESILLYLERPITKGTTKAYNRVRKIIKNKYIDWEIVEEAFDLKYDWEERIANMSHHEKIIFCLKTVSFVTVLGWLAIFTKIYSSIIKPLVERYD